MKYYNQVGVLMTKKITVLLIFFFLIIALYLIFIPISNNNSKSYEINNSYINLEVQDNGLLKVQEVYEYKFNERFNGIKRNFPKTDNQKVNNLKVYSPNAYVDSTIKESKKTTNIMLMFKILI